MERDGMVTSKHGQELIGIVGSGASWLLAYTGWSLPQWRDLSAILAQCGAFAVAMVTIYFMIRNRGKRQ